MPEQLLNRPDIITILQQVSGQRMTKRVTCCGLGNSGFESRFSKCSLQNGLMKMMLTFFSCHTIYVVPGCRNTHCLPHSLPAFTYLRSRALGKATRPKPRLRSSSCCRFTACKCRRRSSLTASLRNQNSSIKCARRSVHGLSMAGGFDYWSAVILGSRTSTFQKRDCHSSRQGR